MKLSTFTIIQLKHSRKTITFRYYSVIDLDYRISVPFEVLILLCQVPCSSALNQHSAPSGYCLRTLHQGEFQRQWCEDKNSCRSCGCNLPTEMEGENKIKILPPSFKLNLQLRLWLCLFCLAWEKSWPFYNANLTLPFLFYMKVHNLFTPFHFLCCILHPIFLYYSVHVSTSKENSILLSLSKLESSLQLTIFVSRLSNF